MKLKGKAGDMLPGGTLQTMRGRKVRTMIRILKWLVKMMEKSETKGLSHELNRYFDRDKLDRDYYDKYQKN